MEKHQFCKSRIVSPKRHIQRPIGTHIRTIRERERYIYIFIQFYNLYFILHLQALKNYRGPIQLDTFRRRPQWDAGRPDGARVADGEVSRSERFRQRSGRRRSRRRPGRRGFTAVSADRYRKANRARSLVRSAECVSLFLATIIPKIRRYPLSGRHKRYGCMSLPVRSASVVDSREARRKSCIQRRFMFPWRFRCGIGHSSRAVGIGRNGGHA